MKKKKMIKISGVLLAFALIFAAICIFSATASAAEAAPDVTATIDSGESVTLRDTDGDGFYEIGNADELFAFAAVVNGGNNTINAILMNDVDLEGRPWTPVGVEGGVNANSYRGVFDGNSKTIRGLYVEAQRNALGFFGEVRDGTVKYFTIYGEVKLNGKHDYVGGVIGSACGTSDDAGATVLGITSYVNVTLGEGSHGSNRVAGLVGYVNHKTNVEYCSWYGTLDLGIYRAQDGVGGIVGKANGNYNGTIRYSAAYGRIRSAYKSGSFNNFDTIYIGGIVSNSVANAKTNIKNCLWAGEIVDETDLGANAHISAIGTLSGVNSVTNCYYLEGTTPYITTNETNNAGIFAVNRSQLRSGEAAYNLGAGWGQKIGTEEYPVPFGKSVFYGYDSCADDAVQVYTNNIYTNLLGKPDHSFENGFCTVCDAYEEPVDGGGYYKISNAGELYWFAAQVNGGNTSINGKLTENITVNENVLNADGTLNGDGIGFRAWTPMGNYNNDILYVGTFEGDGYTVSGLYLNDSNAGYVGLFGCIGDGGKVQNIGLTASYFEADYNVAGIVGSNYGEVINCYNYGTVIGNFRVGGIVGRNNSGKISKCKNTGSVVALDDDVGGITGSNASKATVSDCCNTGKVSYTPTPQRVLGGVVGENYGTVTNCFSTGEISGGVVYTGGVVGDNYGTVINCYYDSSTVTDVAAFGANRANATAIDVLGKTSAEFLSGEVAYLLQQGVAIPDGEESAPEIWGQNLAENGDSIPTFGRAKVYRVTKCESEIVYSNVNENIDHIVGDGVETKSPTCESDGEISYFCESCRTVLHTETVKASHQTSLKHFAATEPLDCVTPGNIEYWYCETCENYYSDPDGEELLNEWFITVTVGCARPVDVADCESFICEVCGAENVPIVSHDVFTCQGGTCSLCEEEIEGIGCANYTTSACMDGVCYYCGGFVAGFGHKNGSWGACVDGECAYGCGLFFPASAGHIDDDGDLLCDDCWNCVGEHIPEADYDICAGGYCLSCFSFIEGTHEYLLECDTACYYCGQLREAPHSVIWVEPKSAECYETGNLEYWQCTECTQVWLDEELTINSNPTAVILPASHTAIIHVPHKNAECYEDGNLEYWQCTECAKVWLDEELTLPSNPSAVVIPIAHAAITHVERIDAGCYETGNLEYWQCTECTQVWLDEELTLASTPSAIVIPVTHTALTHVERIDAECYEDGNLEYWQCTECTQVWLDEELTINSNSSAVIIPRGHNYVSHVCSLCSLHQTESGDCGENAEFVLDLATGILTISGTGAAKGPDNTYSIEKVKEIIIENGITEIGISAFFDFDSVERVTIPDTVTKIGKYAFYFCSSLKAVDIPSGVTEIAESVFSGCTSLERVTIPDNVTVIGKLAFCDCSSLKVVDIPSGVTVIAESVFSGCTSLESVTIPDKVTEIGTSAFSECTSLQAVNIPDGVEKIGSYAFADCASLKTVVIPSGVTEIAGAVFMGCTSLETVVIPSGVTEIATYAFSGCTSLKSINIPDTITAIGDEAFRNCTSLVVVNIPDSVILIDTEAFMECTSLETVTVESGVTEIRRDAFSGCNALVTVNLPCNWDFSYSFTIKTIKLAEHNFVNSVCEVCSKTQIHSGECGESLRYSLDLDARILTVSGTGAMFDYSVTETPWYDFRYDINAVVIESGVTHIGKNAFNGFAAMREVSIPSDVISIGERAFYNCASLTSVIIPAGITSIADFTFYNCSSLAYVSIPSSVISIGRSAFYGCSSLAEVTIPASVNSIGDSAFSNCSSLTDVIIPLGITSIAQRTFNNCSSLVSATIPVSVTSIGINAFHGCTSLKDVIVSCDWDGSLYTFDDGVALNKTLHVSENAYGYCESCQIRFNSASIAIGRDLSLIYAVDIYDKSLVAEGLTVRFTMGERSFTATLVSDESADGRYVAYFRGIGPHQMTEKIDAEILIGDEVALEKLGYTLRENAVSLLQAYKDNEHLVRIVSDMLAYGAAAQHYRDNKTDEPADAGVEITPSNLLPESTDMTISGGENEDVYFKAVGVWFDSVNKLYVKIEGTQGVSVKAYLDGEEIKLTSDSGVLYTDAIYAIGFADVYTFELYVGEQKVETLTYSVKSYVYSMMNKTEADGETLTEMARLARALYNYGNSALLYRQSLTEGANDE